MESVPNSWSPQHDGLSVEVSDRVLCPPEIDPADNAQGQGVYYLIFGCFLLSGATSLVYQVAWLRLLIQVFGGTTLAVSTLLTTFLGGLALGSYAAGRYADRVRRPATALWLYALLELLIGLYGVLTLALFDTAFLGPIWQRLYGVFATAPYVSYLLRFVVVALMLLLPTVCMGATLPLLCKCLAGMRSRAIFDIGKLYTINTAGAVLGTLGAGFYLLPIFGVAYTIGITALLNGLIALVGLGLAMGRLVRTMPAFVDLEESSAGAALPHVQSAEILSTQTMKVVLFCFALSGFTALLLEVAWSRLLTLVLGSSTYAFTTMLGTFLVGLTLGSYLMTHVSIYLKRPVLVLGMIQIFLALSVFGTLFLFEELPWWYVQLAREYQRDWQKFLLGKVGLAALVMLLPTVLSGMVFPLVARIYTSGMHTIAQRVGAIYTINTLGSICGAFITGFVLIPFLSIQWTILLGIVLSLSLGRRLCTLSLNQRHFAQQRPVLYRMLVNAPYVLLLAVFFVFQPGWKRMLMTAGVYVYYPERKAHTTRQQFFESLTEGPQRELLFYKEGLSTVVSVEKSPAGNAIYLKNNGKGEGGVPINPQVVYGGGDMVTQVLLSALPLLLSNGTPEDVLVIGLGTGTTAGSALHSSEVKRLTIAELEEAVVEAEKLFRPENGAPLRQAYVQSGRVRPIITDGRNYLLTTHEQFDVIISQPSEPWISGAAGLFTQEYWQLGREHLKPEGLFCQWIQLYSIDPENLQVLLKTFATVFPKTFVFRPGNAGELLLIGARDSLKLDVAKIQNRLAHAEQKRDLQRIGIHSPLDILSLWLLAPEDVARLTEGAPANTDDNMWIEFAAPKMIDRSLFSMRELFDNLGAHVEADAKAYLANYGTSEVSRRNYLLRLSAAYRKRGAYGPPEQLRTNPYIRRAIELTEGLMTTSPAPEVYAEMALLKVLLGEKSKAQEYYTLLFQLPPQTAEAYTARGEAFFYQQDFDKASQEYQRALQFDPQHVPALLRQAAIHLKKQEVEAALPLLNDVRRVEAENADLYVTFGHYYQVLKQFEQAAESYQQAITYDRYNLAAHDNLGKIYYAAKLYDKAYLEFETVRRSNPSYADPYFYQGVILAIKNDAPTAITYLSQYLQMSPAGSKADEARAKITELQSAQQAAASRKAAS